MKTIKKLFKNSSNKPAPFFGLRSTDTNVVKEWEEESKRNINKAADIWKSSGFAPDYFNEKSLTHLKKLNPEARKNITQSFSLPYAQKTLTKLFAETSGKSPIDIIIKQNPDTQQTISSAMCWRLRKTAHSWRREPDKKSSVGWQSDEALACSALVSN